MYYQRNTPPSGFLEISEAEVTGSMERTKN